MNIGKRIQYMDVAKGIGIIMIVLGHNSLPSVLANYLYAIHVPLFFIISGFFFKQRTFLEELKWGIRHLLFPLWLTKFLWFLLVSMVYWHTGEYTGPSLSALLEGMFFEKGEYAVIIGLWYITALFGARIILNIIGRAKEWLGLLFAIVLFILAKCLYPINNENLFPWCVLQAMGAVVYLFFGHLLKKHNVLPVIASKYVSVVCVVLLLFAYRFPVSVVYFGYPYSILSVLIASLFSICVIYLCISLSTSQFTLCENFVKVLCHYGQYSLCILCFHSLEASVRFERLFSFLPAYSVGLIKVVILGFIPLIISYFGVLAKVYGVQTLRRQ